MKFDQDIPPTSPASIEEHLKTVQEDVKILLGWRKLAFQLSDALKRNRLLLQEAESMGAEHERAIAERDADLLKIVREIDEART